VEGVGEGGVEGVGGVGVGVGVGLGVGVGVEVGVDPLTVKLSSTKFIPAPFV
jgi:hypothetical protein